MPSMFMSITIIMINTDNMEFMGHREAEEILR